MIRKFLMVSWLVLGLCLIAAMPAAAYNMIQTGTQGQVIESLLVSCNDPDGFAHWGPSEYRNIVWHVNQSYLPSGGDSAIRNSAAAWNNVSGADHRIVIGSSTQQGWQIDGQNTMVFARGNGCTGSCGALTTLIMGPDETIIESDITFNRDQVWTTTDLAPLVRNDIQVYATHELGHSLGIGHSTSSSATMSSEIRFSGIAGRSLEGDDVAALRCSQNRYGVRPLRVTVSGISHLDPNEFGTWHCSVSGGVQPYRRQWYRRSFGVAKLGTRSSQTTRDTRSFTIECDVTDALGQFVTDSHSVNVGGGGGGGGGPIIF